MRSAAASFRAGRELGVGVAVPAAVGQAGDDLPVAEELLGPAQDRRHVQLVVHDQAFHLSLLVPPAPQRRDAVLGFVSTVQELGRDLGAEPGAEPVEALDPERALVQPVQHVLPGEADAAVRLDRRLADERPRRRPRRPSPPRPPTGACGSSVGDAPGRPERERARELELGVRVGERVGHEPGRRRSASRTARASPRTRSRARAPVAPTPHGLDRERGAGARVDLGRTVESASRRPGRRRARRRAGGSRPSSSARIALRALELVDPVAADDRDAVGGVEVGDERPEGERPARLARGDLGPQVVRERGQREGDGREERAVVERAPELLEEDGLLDEVEPAPPSSSGIETPVQPSSASCAQVGSGVAARNSRACSRSASCSGVKVKSISGSDFGRPSTRSATMLRRISEVPASIVLPRLRSCWCCQ